VVSVGHKSSFSGSLSFTAQNTFLHLHGNFEHDHGVAILALTGSLGLSGVIFKHCPPYIISCFLAYLSLAAITVTCEPLQSL